MAIAEPVIEIMKFRVLAFLGGTLDLAVPMARIAEDVAALATVLGRDTFMRPRLGAAGCLLAERRAAEAASAKALVADFLAGIAREEAATKRNRAEIQAANDHFAARQAAQAVREAAQKRYLRHREERREADRLRSIGAGSSSKKKR